MIWFISSDIKHYLEIKKLKKDYELEQIIPLPSKKNILEGLSSSKIGFISNMPPEDKYRSFMVLKELSLDGEILTTQEKQYGVKEEEALEKLFGLKVSKPTVTIEKDMIGQNQLRLFYKEVKDNITLETQTEPIFELGVPGVGKSYSASCLAGSLGYSLIQLNLTIFVERGQGVNLLNQFFHYLTTKKPKCVVLFDEFENMVESKAIMGALLSILGSLNDKSQGGYILTPHQILIATANNITDIVKAKPQFFRLGRWSHKFFFNYPIKEDALSTMLYFSTKYSVMVDTEIIEDIYILYMGEYVDNFVAPRSVYSQVELKFLFKSFECMNLKELKNKNKQKYKELLLQTIKNIIPSQVNTRQGIARLLSDARSNKFKEVDSV